MLIFELDIHKDRLPLPSTPSLHGIANVVGYDSIDPFDGVSDSNTGSLGFAPVCYPCQETEHWIRLNFNEYFQNVRKRPSLFVGMTRYGRRASSDWAISQFEAAELGEPGNHKRLRKIAVTE
ncbi:MAG: hypothetical protein BWY17_04320 [Deltaproteobacteria bacterium ADurb.Bin207]|jgi:hypothetical protein|nr:MAG: hypothetical protein BWY17_04320 [Deltaproteobacteria bacterium ADurb.Bin207]